LFRAKKLQSVSTRRWRKMQPAPWRTCSSKAWAWIAWRPIWLWATWTTTRFRWVLRMPM